MRPMKSWIACSALAAVLAPILVLGMACRPAASPSQKAGGQAAAGGGTAQAAAGSEASGEPGASAAQSWLDDFTIGHQVDTEGAIPVAKRGDDFTAGQTVYVAMEVGEAPAGAAVHVAFEDGSGRTVAEDEKKVSMGAKYLYFDSGDTSSWAAGDYRATISVAGRSVDDQHFTVIASPEGGGT